MDKKAQADVRLLRQTSQYTCCAASIASALHALGKHVSEDDVNKVLGAAPMAGASWEAMLATVQYFGCRGTLVVPATPRMLKTWTDQGIPVVIAWNPEGRPWSHASTVFNVVEDLGGKLAVHVMDPNIPNPSETVRVLDEDSFCQKWGEKVSDSLIVRRPAMAVTREVTPEGRQVVASSHLASRSRYCHFYLASNGKWYMELAEEEYGEREDADTWGPFPSFEAAEDFCDRFSNPGGFSEDDSGEESPPSRSPNGGPVRSPRSFNQGGRWATTIKRVAQRYLAGKQPQPFQPKKDDTSMTIPAPSRREPVFQQMVERGPGGAGTHHTRERDVDRGRSRKPKHKRPWSDAMAQEGDS